MGGYVDPDFPNPKGPNDAPIIIYGYTPSLVLAILAVLLFAISAGLHAYQIFRYRTKYMIPIVIGCVMEAIGYTFRIISNRQSPYNINWYVIQYFFIVCAGVVITSSIYAMLTKLIDATGQRYSLLAPKTVLIIFLACDFFATIIQMAGSAAIGAMETAQKDSSTAKYILLSGLVFQVVAFLVFLILLSNFIYRARHVILSILRPFTVAMLAATILIYIRTLYRMAETVRAVNKKHPTTEAWFGVLEFAPVVVAVFLFNVWHPGAWINKLRTTDILMKEQS